MTSNIQNYNTISLPCSEKKNDFNNNANEQALDDTNPITERLGMAFKEAADKNQISTLQAVAKCWKKSGYTIKDSSYLEEYTGMALQEAKSKYLAIKNIRKKY